MKLYSNFGARPKQATLEWKFPSKMTMKFAHLEHESTVLDYQGSQIPFIGFDEVTHFSEQQFFYMLSRNRSMSGVPGYIRATCNPDPDSWVRRFLDWWIGEDGFPIKERSGVIRWFIRLDDRFIWADSRDEIRDKYGHTPGIQPKSVTFISSSIYDNKILLEKDPAYLANLLALPRVDRLRLLGGNWNVRATAGSMFKREWFQIVDAIPPGFISQVRYWDRAATKPHESNPDPDWTRGVKLLRYPDDICIVSDLRSIQGTPQEVEHLVKTTASHDGYHTTIWGEQDPGSAGVADATRFVAMLRGFHVKIAKPSKAKVTRAKPVSSQSEHGFIKVLRAPWNEEFFRELENFPGPGHDDIVDAFSGAFNESSNGLSILDVL
jgi:predicted phage terminase large subunit-like protein